MGQLDEILVGRVAGNHNCPTYLNSMLLVLDCVCCDWRMVATQQSCSLRLSNVLQGVWSFHAPHLLTDQSGLAHVRVGAVSKPLADEQLSQEGVQRLLLATELLTSAAVLLVQGGEEPLEHEEGTLLGISLLSGRDEDGGVFSPVGRVLGERGC